MNECIPIDDIEIFLKKNPSVGILIREPSERESIDTKRFFDKRGLNTRVVLDEFGDFYQIEITGENFRGNNYAKM